MNQQLKQRIEETTYTILHENNLFDWTVEFGSAYRVFGSCNHTDKKIRFSIRLAEATSWDETYDTILHEIAHAIAGYDAGHGPRWQQVARELGIKNPQATSNAGDIEMEAPWVGTCPNGHVKVMLRAPRRIHLCSKCSRGRFNMDFLFDWKKNGKKVPMPAKYERDLESTKIDMELKAILESRELADILG